MRPETKRLKDYAKEWRKEGLSGGYEDAAASLQASAEDLDGSYVTACAALHQALSQVEGGGSSFVLNQAKRSLQDAYEPLKRAIESGKITQGAYGNRIDSLPDYGETVASSHGRAFRRAHEVRRGQEGLLERAEALRSKMSRATVGFGSEWQEAVRRATPECHVALPPGTRAG